MELSNNLLIQFKVQLRRIPAHTERRAKRNENSVMAAETGNRMKQEEEN